MITLTACSDQSNKRMYLKKVSEVISAVDKIPADDAEDGDSTHASFIGSPNFGLRNPSYIIIHHTAEKDPDVAIKRMTDTMAGVSAHYLVKKNGDIVNFVHPGLRAWHAGLSKWGTNPDMNSVSIGIELDNNGYEAYSSTQIAALVKLLKRLKSEYHIPSTNFLGHSDITVRKVDPSSNFPWATLAKHNLGIWKDDTLKPVPSNYNSLYALKVIGYDVRDTMSAIRAFKQHYVQTDLSDSLSYHDKQVLFNIATKIINQQ